MNIKEIVVWIGHNHENIITDRIMTCYPCSYTSGDSHAYSTKAKLIIEIPEKKIEITESEFLRMWQTANGCTWRNGIEANLYIKLKKELGF